jgi:hypothetical protein
MSTKATWFDRHRIEGLAVALQRAAHEADVELPRSYVLRVAATIAEGDGELGASRLGNGLVLHTVPATKDRLPIIVGYADSRGQWYRDGSRHADGPIAEEPVKGMEIGL